MPRHRVSPSAIPMTGSSGTSSTPRLSSVIATLRITASPAFAGDDNVRDEWSTSNMQDLMKGKRGLIMGVANDHSIAWGIAKALAAQGAELAFTYQGEALGKRVKPLAEQLGVPLVLPCDVEDIASVDAVFETLRGKWGQLDFLVHAIGFTDKNELRGRYADTTRENFSRTMVISCFSFTEIARRAADLMPEAGGSIVTLTFGGSTRVMPNYNVMGVAKAALEASVRYLAFDFGRRKIRVNSISAGPVRTLAGAVIGDSRAMFAFQQKHSPLGRGVTLDELGGSALYLLSDLSTGVTGEIHYVDSGYNIISMPRPEDLKNTAE
jgi:enoyl-[acyl-carrier protein] reductase I